ncbi:MAG: DUF1820 family protein [Gammaproteobacteria bacterium]
MPDPATLFKVIFVNQGKVYEIYAHAVSQTSLMGFVEVEELTFGEDSALLVNPAEERLRDEFKGVKRSYIPLHAVIRIDEVERRGEARIHDIDGAGNVTAFPGAFGFQGPPRKD